MTTSNSSDPVSADTAAGAASSADTSAQNTATTQASATPVAGTSEAPKGESLPDPNGKESAPAAALPPSFQPNWKFKAFGKEREIEEFWRPLIKDADSEKRVKDIFTQAYAFEDMKAKQDSTSKEFQGLLGEYQALDKDVKRVMTFRNNRDFDNFFRSLRISDQEIFDYVQQKLNHLENPQARQMSEMQAQERQKQYDLQMENETLQSQYQQQAVQARSMQLDMILSRPDVAKAASLFDERQGQIGAFRQLVIDTAGSHYYATGGDNGGKDLSAEEAIQMVMQRWGKFLDSSQAGSMTSQPIAAPPQAQPKPVIPAVQGKGTSPIKKAPKNLDDLRQLAKEAQQTN